MHISELVSELKLLLKPTEFRDYCPNGLQVEGRQEVQSILTGVTACEALIDQAIEKKADAILVHHGYFWQGESPVLQGIKKTRIKKLLAHDISLLAYHLPLDAHPELGNNAQLGNIMGFTSEADMVPGFRSKVGVWGSVAEPCSGAAMAERISQRLQRKPLYVAGTKALIEKVAWCTGGAQSAIETAYQCGVDAYITGEASEQTVHFARESGLHFFAAGHHATERYGVKALGEYLAATFGLQQEFVDIDNPV